MLTKASEKDRKEIINYCLSEPIINIFIIGDIENFGFSSEFQDIWYQRKNNKIVGLILRYHNSLIVYSKDLDMDFNLIGDLLDEFSIDIINGKSTVIDALYEFLPGNFNRKNMNFCEHKHSTALAEITEDIKIANKDEAMDIAIAYGNISEFKYLYSEDVNKRYEQIFNRINSGEGKHLLIRDESVILAHGNTTAENSFSGMIGGIFTREEERNKGYGTQIISALTKDLLSRNKSVCLFYGNEKEGRIFKKLGFEIIGKWTVLGRIKDEQTFSTSK